RGIPNKSIGKEEQKELLSLSAASAVQHPERWTQKAKDYFTKTFSRAISSFDNLYAIDLLLDRIRLPQFHAGLNRKNNNWFCSIGYNSWLHRLSMIQSPQKRASSDIPFRLIENSTSELLYFPFDSKSWKYLAFAHRPDAARFLQIKPVKNTANRPMPSKTNLVKQARFLIENNVPLDSSIFEVFDEKWLKATMDRAKLTIAGKAPEDRGVLRLLIDIYGTSLFMQSKEGNSSAGCPTPVPFSAQSIISQIKPLYKVDKSWYNEPAEQVLKNGELCFEKQKVFRQSDHNTLNDFEKFIFDLDLEHGRLEAELNKANTSLRRETNAKKSITAKFDVLDQKTKSSTWLFKQWLNHNKTKLAKSLHLTKK
ncbi:MAG: hypothetical protein LBB93_05710, partial [Elusimicrobiota bacterium]|nr:hypothetical protein [Elusimicrobiota bacterium]